MPNKELRILIADEQHFQRVSVEKMLNHLGYHRIAPVESFEEVCTLTASPGEPFDLLIANSSLAATAGVDFIEFCRASGQVYHSLIYDVGSAQFPDVSVSSYEGVHRSLARFPDIQSIKSLMGLIDKPDLMSIFQAMPWLRAIFRRRAV